MIRKIMMFTFLLMLTISCKKKLEGDIKYLPENWDDVNFVNADGQEINLNSFRGKYKTIYFGFSHCPDMCPTALSSLSVALQILGPKANSFESIFITLDPERDSPDQMKRYTEMFKGKKFTALVPNEEALLKISSVFNIQKFKKETGDGYTIDHSNFIFLIGENNEQIATYPGGTKPETLAKEFREIIP